MISILIPSIPERIDQLKAVINRYESLLDQYLINAQILVCMDNKKMTIGEKRNNLVSMAKYDYWVMSDEDDQLTEKYFELIKSAITETWPDVITYQQSARINEDRTTVEFGLGLQNQEFVTNGITQRMAWHCCTWRKQAVKDARFDSSLNWGEDDCFARAANKLAKTSVHIPEICHNYEHDSQKTAAFQ